MAALYDSMSIDHFERERALRVVEKQRGALSNTRATNSKMTTSRHRQIAEHWDDIVWPHLVASSKPSQVTQAAVLRRIKETQPLGPSGCQKGP
jgi:hypothetical protein